MAKINGEKLRKRLTSVVIRNEHLDYDNYWGKGWNDAMHCAIRTLDLMISKAEKKAKKKLFTIDNTKVKYDSENNAKSSVELVFGINKEERIAWTYYEGRTILFDVVELNGDEYTLVSHNILCFLPFDSRGCTNYDDSDIHVYLNEEFERRFSKDFISMLTDKGFYLPSRNEIEKYYPKESDRIKNYKGGAYEYWLSDTTDNTVECVSSVGIFYRTHSAGSQKGILPACKVIMPNKAIIKKETP